MKYCTKCITPETRPNITFNSEGVCNGCSAHAQRLKINWAQREKLFEDLIAVTKSKEARYDCVIPVSGGKDSTWQVVKCLEIGLHPLAVTWKTPARTELGAQNLANLVSLGVDHIDYQVNPKVERKFLLQSFTRFGTTAIPMHMALFNIPLIIAFKFEIPLVIWGENSATEYGGSDDDQGKFQLNSEWLRTYGVTHGTFAKDWISKDLTKNELAPYFGPSDEELNGKDIRAIFLGYFFPWDPETSLRVAMSHGFKVRQEGPKTGYYNFADIDDDFISIHHYLKWHKFGFTRTFDNLSLEIRNGRMDRPQAIEILRIQGEERPDEDIAKFCAFSDLSIADFWEIVEKFRNKKIWTKRNEKWAIDGFLIPGWKW